MIGKSVKVDYLRGGSSQSADVVLTARPTSTAEQPSQQSNNNPNSTPRLVTPKAALGIAGIALDSSLDQAMNLKQDQKGILVERVVPGSPADKAGLKAGSTPFDYQGQQVMVGGDIITAVKGTPITSIQELRNAFNGGKAGDQYSLTILRSGKEMTVDVTLAGN